MIGLLTGAGQKEIRNQVGNRNPPRQEVPGNQGLHPRRQEETRVVQHESTTYNNMSLMAQYTAVWMDTIAHAANSGRIDSIRCPDLRARRIRIARQVCRFLNRDLAC